MPDNEWEGYRTVERNLHTGDIRSKRLTKAVIPPPTEHIHWCWRALAAITFVFYVPFYFWVVTIAEFPDDVSRYTTWLIGFLMVVGYIVGLVFGVFLAFVVVDPIEKDQRRYLG